MAISLWWVCLGQYALYNRKNRVWLNNLSNQERLCFRVCEERRKKKEIKRIEKTKPIQKK
jgi:hypothetical protein